MIFDRILTLNKKSGAKTFSELWKGQGLYVCRKLLNADELHAWALKAGVPNVVPPSEMHVTNVYSRKSVELSVKTNNVIAVGGARSIEPLGDKGAVVLMFESQELSVRWQEAADAGAAWDYETGYHPHVTLSYDAGANLSAIEPPEFVLEFGPEIHEPINENWAEDNGLRVVKDLTRSDVHVASNITFSEAYKRRKSQRGKARVR